MEMNLLNLQNLLHDQGVLISFSGRFTQTIIEELGEAVKKYLETEATPQNDIFNVFSIFIEQTQNIKNYSMQKSGVSLGERIANSSIVAIGKTEEGYFVSSGNLIESEDVGALTARLDALAAHDKAGLKKLYKEVLRKEIPPGSIGAGLGFIDMARRVRRPLHYSVVSMDGQLSFFTLRAYV